MQVPALFAGFVDDAAVFPPGSAPLPEAIQAHRTHRAAWYSTMVGPLLVPVSVLAGVPARLDPAESLTIGIVADTETGIGGVAAMLDELDERLAVRQVEAVVAKRGEDPQPGLAALRRLLIGKPSLTGYAEIPLTWGLLAALDTVAEAQAAGIRMAPKFRTGGLAAELFPTPVELAAVICACRDRGLSFKLTAGLHQAVRHTDPETGFVHHGFLNVLVGAAEAAGGAEPAEVAEILASTDPVTLIESARQRLAQARPLWIGFGTCSIAEPLDDLRRFGLLEEAR